MRGSALLVAMAIGSCRSAGESSPSGPATASASPSTSPPASTSTPAPTASDPCARTADLDARAAEAQSLYGATVRTAVVDGAFLFVDADHGALFDDATRFAPRVLAAYHHERVGPAPLCPVTVTLFSSHARFLVHCASRGYPVAGVDNLGLYDPLRREIVADLSGGASHLPTIAHELLHPLMDADFGGAPRWFRECVGTLYEAPVLREGGEIHGMPNWRYARLRAAIAAGDPDAHLDALFGMSDAVFRGKTDAGVDDERELLHYAAARAACEWLDDHGQLWPFYRAWRDSFAEDHDGRASFARAAGRSPADADTPWRAWVLGTR